jgi:hypothetical protein
MSQGKSAAHQISVDRFWDNYLFILKKNAIPKSSIPWYRKHAEAYIKANKNTPLSISDIRVAPTQPLDLKQKSLIMMPYMRLKCYFSGSKTLF